MADLEYELPDKLVAQTPAEPRDASRLLVLHREDGALEDRVFSDLPDLLRDGDVLVRNDTRVFPARSFFRRATGGRIEVLFLCAVQAGATGERWEVLLRGRPRSGEILENEVLGSAWPLRCDEPVGDGRWLVDSLGAAPVLELLEGAGVTPLPPYITTPLEDPERYQTTYACALGSAAAPTAGLHFTPALDARLAAAGVQLETVTLHVGLGTFKPLQAESLGAATLHAEAYEVAADAWQRLVEARRDARRIIAVGTTSMRVLEHLALLEDQACRPGAPAAGGGIPLRGETRLFIRPGFEFRMVGGLVTNFHLPRTSLLALVMAFCGAEQTRAVYRHAVERRYRFYSFGDAMVAL
ncbi:MAG: tRNA preQ1(34) S-adenosylmethionine ribosyltransferase-isomerase QueA [Actinobacteria bacterium]|nr:tRNA preQ1(34) S-adenosylmethionine ribosyltransferase-isomerase QueA [Actinomycetota bacterium]